MDAKKLAAIFNEWARRYAENPSEFGEILDANGKAVSDYGEKCAVYFNRISTDIDATTIPPPPRA